MTQPSARTMPARPGDIGAPDETRSSRLSGNRSSPAARRRWLILAAVVVLVVVAFLANIGPLTHYQDARARLDKVTAKADTLETQKAELQGQLAKLTETGYLETLAREQLTYVRPGEELYIVTKPAGDTGAPAAATGLAPVAMGSGIGAGAVDDLGSQATDAHDPSTNATGTDAAQSPGFFERVISAIRGFF